MHLQADAAWDAAENASIKAGNPFKDRHGHIKYPTPKRIGMLQRVLDELQRRIDSREIEWPPPLWG